MPYVTNDVKVYIDKGGPPSTAGQLNYQITSCLLDYLQTKGLSYQTINDILGALEGSKLEFYTRIARPYEDTKITENGDVYK